jgi:hypothetical protein
MNWENTLTVIIVAVIAVVAIRRQFRKRQYVREWAKRRELVILKRLPTWFRVSPFVLTAIMSKQSIHYLLIRDKEGIERRCWLKVGDWFLGHLADDVHVLWESSPPQDWDPTAR